MTTLYLVRHGQASFASANYDNLSPLGHRQSAWLGEHFASRGIAFARAVSGTLERQRQTARTLLDAMGTPMKVEEHPGWNEYSGDALYRAYHGEGWAKARAKGDVREFYRTIKAALLDWSEEKLAGDLPETWREFGERTSAAMRTACEGLPADACVMAASSGGAISRAVSTILQAPAQAAIELNLQYRNSAFCEIFVSPRSMRLVSFNSIPHLDRPDRADAITYS